MRIVEMGERAGVKEGSKDCGARMLDVFYVDLLIGLKSMHVNIHA